MISEKQIKTELASLMMLGRSDIHIGQIKGLAYALTGIHFPHCTIRELIETICPNLHWDYRIHKNNNDIDVNWHDEVDEDYLAKEGVTIFHTPFTKEIS